MADLPHIIATLNVKGLNSPTKRSLVRRVFRKEALDVLFIQETHFKNSGEYSLLDNRIGYACLASGEKKKQGLAS